MLGVISAAQPLNESAAIKDARCPRTAVICETLGGYSLGFLAHSLIHEIRLPKAHVCYLSALTGSRKPA
jgi:hypothetical protein